LIYSFLPGSLDVINIIAVSVGYLINTQYNMMKIFKSGNLVEAGYVDNPKDFRYSSARAYAGGKGILETEFL
jgi:hypothetical protein